MGLLPLINADIRALFFDNRLAVSSKQYKTCLVRCRLSQRLKIYEIDARVFSNTFDGDIITAVRVIPGTLATRGP